MPVTLQFSMFLFHCQEMLISICKVDETQYFMCQAEDMRVLASLIEPVKMELKDRYVFCCAPIPHRYPFVGTMFLKVQSR